jgi:hypothetical protein
MTISDLIKSSLSLIDVNAINEEPHSEDVQATLVTLNMLLDSWSTERLMAYYLKNEIFNLIASTSQYYIGQTKSFHLVGSANGGYITTTFNGSLNVTTNYITQTGYGIYTTLAQHAIDCISAAGNYISDCKVAQGTSNQDVTITFYGTGLRTLTPVIGVLTLTQPGSAPVIANTIATVPAGYFDTSRPIKITGAFTRDNTGTYAIDRPLEIIPNDEYQAITLKALTTIYPQYLNYVPQLPYGIINIWPVSLKTLQLSISQTMQFINIENNGLTDNIQLPQGYEMALRYNLAIEIAPQYGIQPSPFLMAQANKYKALLKTVNSEPVYMSSDPALMTRKGSTYNVYSDRMGR